MSAVLLAAIGAHGAVALFFVVVVAGCLAALAYWLLGMIAPHPIPVIAAILVFLFVIWWAVG